MVVKKKKKRAHKNIVLKWVLFIPLPLVFPNTILEDEMDDTSQFVLMLYLNLFISLVL